MHLVWADKACIKTSIFVLEEQVGLKYTQIFWEMCHQFLKENKLKSSDFLFCIMKVTGFSSENFLSLFCLQKFKPGEKRIKAAALLEVMFNLLCRHTLSSEKNDIIQQQTERARRGCCTF